LQKVLKEIGETVDQMSPCHQVCRGDLSRLANGAVPHSTRPWAESGGDGGVWWKGGTNPCLFSLYLHRFSIALRLCNGFCRFAMVFNGFSMVFRQVVGTMPSVESSTILSNLTREGFGYNFTARMRNCSGSEFDYVEVQMVHRVQLKPL
jgi:hypothetical protein